MYGPDDPKKTEHLVSLDGAEERLHLFKADLLEEGSFDSVVEACEGVFHTASPVILSPTDPKVNLCAVFITPIIEIVSVPMDYSCRNFLRFFLPTFQAQLIDPALKGTLNVLRSCIKVPSLKRIVLTSSMSSVSFNGKPLTPDVVVDETWFSDPTLCEESKV